MLTDHDIYLFKQGTHCRLYEKLGAHYRPDATRFALWAPNARAVSVIGDFNRWDAARHPLHTRGDGSGIWETEIAGVAPGAHYKFRLLTADNHAADKADPFAFATEVPPLTASRVWQSSYRWRDADWLAARARTQGLDQPWSIYEVHLGSWRRDPGAPDRVLNYRDYAEALAEYVGALGFTHVELLPILEHPFYGSWGYQVTGFFAPTARYGAPEDFQYLVDTLHQAGIGVILDWVPSHFPDDAHGLVRFDGTALYEHVDPRQGFHPQWRSQIFNYGRHEVRGFLLSSACYWLERFHIDALRVDAVASMLYLDYAREPGDWIPNTAGGRENLDAVRFLQDLNRAIYRDYQGVQTIAEESTAWPMVTRPVHDGGLGFGMKWNMGWMHDTLVYLGREPVHRRHHHNQITFSIWYAFNENFVLPLSHDEVVYGKRALVAKMPGDEWQRHAQLRLLYGYLWAHPGKKLLFMGGEFAQTDEWYHETQLAWSLLSNPASAGVQALVRHLNGLYRRERALYQHDFQARGFAWIEVHDADHSVIAFERHAEGEIIVVACNFTPVPRPAYRLGVTRTGGWREILNTDAREYGGSGLGNLGRVESTAIPSHGRPHSLTLTLPPLAVLYLKPDTSD